MSQNHRSLIDHFADQRVTNWTLLLLVLLVFTMACGAPPTDGTPSSGAVDAASDQPSAGEVPEIVLRALDHHGSAILENSRVTLTVSSQSGSFDVAAELGPVFDFVVRQGDGDDLLERRHTNKSGEPEVSEIRGSGALKALEGDAAQVVKDYVSARIYFLFFPYRLEDPNTYLRDLGTESWNGRSLHKVELSFEAGTSTNSRERFLFWFEPESAELEQFAYSFDGGIRFRKLVDQRRIGGVLFASHENYGHDRDVSVDVITPEFAAEMDLLSVVELKDIGIEAR